MKCQYESEILYKLMERDGFNIPSSVPPYEAEIKAYLINQVKQAYPKLTDYEAEWLLYNYTKHLPADFPISSATNVVKATFENVVPFAYQNAILKGNTLVNIVSQQLFGGNPLLYLSHFKEHPFKAGETFTVFVVNPNVSTIHVGLSTVSNGAWSGEEKINVSNIKKILYTVPTGKTTNYVGVKVLNDNDSTGFENSLVILKGNQMHLNIDRYFEGMQSVKMPVLTSYDSKSVTNIPIDFFEKNTPISVAGFSMFAYETNKNFKMIATLNEYLDGDNDVRIGVRHTNGVIQTKNLSIGVEETIESPSVVFFGFYSEKMKPLNGSTPQKSNILEYIKSGKLNLRFEIGDENFYPPYNNKNALKSNILTANEDVTLRGIGEVRDELDLLTGEVTQRIGEVVLNGSENWDFGTTKELTQVFETKISTAPDKTYQINSLGLPNGANGKDIEALIFVDNGSLYISLLKTKASTVEELKTYLSSHPITVQYHLATESIKTVDLTTVNEKGETTYFMPIEGTMNVQSSGETIQPTFDMSVPVEATTQNLASFIDLEME